VLHFAGADAERQGAERAMRGRVAVTADDGLARLREAALGTDHVHDAVLEVAEAVERDAELRAVGGEHVELRRGLRVDDLQLLRVGRRAVVHGGERVLGAARLEAALAQTRERLRRGHLVDEVQVDVEHGRAALLFGDHVLFPDLLEQGLRLLLTGGHLRFLFSERWRGLAQTEGATSASRAERFCWTESRRFSDARYALALATMTSVWAPCP
jgi:hypothetical protein